MESFFEKVTGQKLENSGVHVISVGGTSFKRYLDIAKLLKIKCAVIRDNDKEYKINCIDNYQSYVNEDIRIFCCSNNEINTFEKAIYQTNMMICEELFNTKRRSLSVEEYMLKNKADVAFELLDKKASDLVAPEYINSAIKWIIK